MWALCGNDLLLLSLLLFIQFSCSICQTICLLVTPFLFFFSPFFMLQVHTFRGPHWCEYCANFMWGLIAQGVRCSGSLQTFSVFIGKCSGIHPTHSSLHALQEGQAGVPLQNMPSRPPVPIRALSFSLVPESTD